jgi:hypothetical protein
MTLLALYSITLTLAILAGVLCLPWLALRAEKEGK